MKSEPLELENLEVRIKDKTGQEYAFSKKKILDVLKAKGVLELLEFTNNIEVEIYDYLIITVKRKGD